MKKEKRYQLINKDETYIFCISQRKDDCIFHNLRLQDPDNFIVKEAEMDCMSEGEKQLFFKDLIQRIDARPKLHRDINRSREHVEIQELMGVQLGSAINTIYTDYEEIDINYANYIFDVRLYLRPMSSMTSEEVIEFEKTCRFKCYPKHVNETFFDNDRTDFNTGDDDYEYRYIRNEHVINCIDWLNAHHFDYRGLIEKGLAIEAPKGIYN